MFKKRNLKSQNASKRREEIQHAPEDTEISSFTSERPLKKNKLDAKATKSIDSVNISQAESMKKPEATQDSDRQSDDIKPRAVGPKPAPKNVRVTTLTDFQPDVCKDFQQTGYCGYGDTCKFLHIRDESRQKAPIEKEWETVKNDASEADKVTVDESVPFKCPICKDDYKSPVKTSCGHIFCQTCFMKRFKTEKKRKCYICKQDTGGAVQPVKDIGKVDANRN